MKEPTKAQIRKEFTCSMCKKEFDEICSFTPYGNPKRVEEYQKNKNYCNSCFEIKEKEIS